MVTPVRQMEVCEATVKKSGNRLKLGPLTRTTLYQPTLKDTKTQTTDFRYIFLSVFFRFRAPNNSDHPFFCIAQPNLEADFS